MNIEKYFERIGFQGKRAVDLACLKRLHSCHVMSVPFEALDVTLKNEIKLDLDSIYKKVVLRHRGGYCYELNFLFYHLLSEIGFRCFMVSSRIFENDSFGSAFDHMSLIVNLEEKYLVDVAYGDLFIEPLEISAKHIQEDRFKSYKIEPWNTHGFILLESLKGKSEFKKRYCFDLEPQKIEAFFAQNRLKQFSPDSYFVKNMVCTQPTEKGRKTIFNRVFKVKKGDCVEEQLIESKCNLLNLLQQEFDIKLPKNAFDEMNWK